MRIGMTRWMGALAAATVLTAPALGGGEPVPHAYTYQGQLLDLNEPYSGAVDLEFRLFDAGVDGTQLGDSLFFELDLVDGLFVVDLDF